MASLFGSTSFLSHPLTRTYHLASSQTPSPSTPPSQPPQTPPSPSPSLSTSSADQLKPAPSKVEQQRSTTNVDSTDWIASTLTRRFGLGAGLAWAAFLAVGVVSEQIKTRLEVSQEVANTRSSIHLPFQWFSRYSCSEYVISLASEASGILGIVVNNRMPPRCLLWFPTKIVEHQNGFYYKKKLN